MSQQDATLVTGPDGLRGTLDPAALGPQRSVRITLEHGGEVFVPSEALVPQRDGTFRLPLGADALRRAEAAEEPVVVPLLEETLHVGKRQVETGRVRIVKTVHEREEVIDEPLFREEIEVRRVPVDRIVGAVPSIRQEGNTMIIPVLEEVLVVEKRLRLKEEVHLIRHRVARRQSERVVLRHEEAAVERHRGATNHPESDSESA